MCSTNGTHFILSTLMFLLMIYSLGFLQSCFLVEAALGGALTGMSLGTMWLNLEELCFGKQRWEQYVLLGSALSVLFGF